MTGEAGNGGVVGGRDGRGEGAVVQVEAPIAVGGFHIGEADGAIKDDHAIFVLDVVEGAEAGGVAAGEDLAIGAGELGQAGDLADTDALGAVVGLEDDVATVGAEVLCGESERVAADCPGVGVALGVDDLTFYGRDVVVGEGFVDGVFVIQDGGGAGGVEAEVAAPDVAGERLRQLWGCGGFWGIGVAWRGGVCGAKFAGDGGEITLGEAGELEVLASADLFQQSEVEFAVREGEVKSMIGTW